MKKKNVLFLSTDVFSKGGVQRYARYQIRAFQEILGIKSLYVFSLWGKNEENLFEGEQEADYIGTGAHIFSKILFSLNAIFFAKNKKIDLIVCNHISLTPIAFFIKKIFKIPYIVDVYGLEIWNGLKKINEKGLLNAEAIIGDCNFILNYIEKNFKIDSKKLFLLYDCVDIDVFSPKQVPSEFYSKYKIPSNKKIIGTIGRLVYDKGQETMIKLMKFLSNDFIYIVVGGGVKMNDWKELAKSEGVEKRVIFTGRISDNELLYAYNIFNLSIYLSEFKKNEGGGLPLVLIESSACGKPIIASNEDGAKEAVRDSYNGFVVSPRDYKIIIKKINYLFDHPDVMSIMGGNGREYVHINFSYEKFKETQKIILDTIMI